MRKNTSSIKNSNILIASGGTGGHIFPALSIANELKGLGSNIYWVSSKSKIDKKVKKDARKVLFTNMRGIRGVGFIQKVQMLFKLFGDIILSCKFILKHKIDGVIAFGGYMSFAPSIAARLLRKPVLIHEQNAKLGLSNYYLSFLATAIMTAYNITVKRKVIVYYVGMPIRDDIRKLYIKEKEFNKNRLNVLVLGGSQGAKKINEIVPKALSILPEDLNISVFHQSGDLHLNQTIEIYESLGVKAKIKGFVDDMADVYSWADIVICRSGAGTVFEVSAVGVPAIFIPYPYAADNHQYENIIPLVKNGSCKYLNDNNLDEQTLYNSIVELVKDPKKLKYCSNKLKDFYKNSYTTEITRIIEKYI